MGHPYFYVTTGVSPEIDRPANAVSSCSMQEPDTPSKPSGGPFPEPGTGAETLSCPEGKQCRLTLINARESLVYCAPVQPGLCPHVMSFEGTRYCRALLGSPRRTLASEKGNAGEES